MMNGKGVYVMQKAVQRNAAVADYLAQFANDICEEHYCKGLVDFGRHGFVVSFWWDSPLSEADSIDALLEGIRWTYLFADFRKRFRFKSCRWHDDAKNPGLTLYIRPRDAGAGE